MTSPQKNVIHMLDLPGFAGGELYLMLRFQATSMYLAIQTEGPGSIYVAQDGNGPKDWSPHGSVPGDWQLIYTVKEDDVLRCFFEYKKNNGNECQVDYWTRLPPKHRSIYFVPNLGQSVNLSKY